MKYQISHQPGEAWDHDPGESVDKTDGGDGDEEEPPEPKDEEILLVEDIIVENAEIVAPVDSTSCGSNTNIARDLKIKITN